MANIPRGRWVSALLGLLISVGAIVTLIKIISPSEFKSAFSTFNPLYIAPFALAVALMVFCFGYRWGVLLRGGIPLPLAIKALIINMGANMVLPARGGDLLRIHYSYAQGKVPVVVLIGALMVEKAADLLAICLIGIVGGVLMGPSDAKRRAVVTAAAAIFVLLLAFLVFVRTQNGVVRRVIRWAFTKLRREKLFHQHVSPLVMLLGEGLELKVFTRTLTITIVLWLVIYAASYLCVAQLVGVSLSYTEALVVLWASGLGLMIPAAPSGLGVYHVTVVSAFYFLGRPIAEGLVLATALHIGFFVALVTPMGLFYGKWLLGRSLGR